MMEKTAKDAMTPLSKAFSIDINSKLDMHVSCNLNANATSENTGASVLISGFPCFL